MQLIYDSAVVIAKLELVALHKIAIMLNASSIKMQKAK